MNRKTPSLATLFAAGAFVAASAAPLVAATPVASGHAGIALAEAGCGAKGTKEAKDAKCGKAGKSKKEAKGTSKKGQKDASCGKGSCGSKKG